MEKTASNDIPEVVIRRLPVYARALAHLEQDGVSVVSSRELGEQLQVSSAQIRKDLSYFGEFGKQGTGYDVRHLMSEIRRILGVDRVWPMVVVGIGNLGSAIARYPGFVGQGFQIVGLFDSNPERMGRRVGDYVVQDLADLPDLVRERSVKIAVIAARAVEAQTVVDACVEAGIKAILTYAAKAVRVPPNVRIQYSDPTVSLQSLTYHLVREQDGPAVGD
ncbi:MAG: redox-sensing transcriptional repressor Rex [Chloroflexi bacterium]|nr:redox-sensing transcriptional repressor Rex [Chloroflexota bacterium]